MSDPAADQASEKGKGPPWFAGFVFVAVMLGAPAYELSKGVFPASRFEELPSREEIVSGKSARRIESELSRDSVVIKALRPTYLEFLFHATQIHNEATTIGRDRWLFLSSTISAVPPKYPEEKMRGLASVYGRLSKLLAARGTTLIIALIPNKATVYPEKLPPRFSHLRSHYPRIIADLQEAGVEAPDLLPTYRRPGTLSFYPNDTHHSPEGALGLARTLRDEIVRLRGDVPGKPQEVDVKTMDRIHRGDLQKLLGFDAESDLDKKWDVPITVRIPYDPATKLLLEAPRYAPVMLIGTSFSHSSFLFGQLASVSGKQIGDRSLPRVPSSWAFVEFLQDVDAGKGPAPEVLVLEFPERYLFQSFEEYETRIRHYLDIRKEKKRFAEAEVRAIPFDRLSLRDVKLDPVPGRPRRWHGVPETVDPILIFPVDPPIPADGRTAISYSIASPSRTATQVWWRTEAGYKKPNSVTFKLHGSKNSQHFIHVLEGGGTIDQIRLDPVSSKDPFTITNLELRRIH